MARRFVSLWLLFSVVSAVGCASQGPNVVRPDPVPVTCVAYFQRPSGQSPHAVCRFVITTERWASCIDRLSHHTDWFGDMGMELGARAFARGMTVHVISGDRTSALSSLFASRSIGEETTECEWQGRDNGQEVLILLTPSGVRHVRVIDLKGWLSEPDVAKLIAVAFPCIVERYRVFRELMIAVHDFATENATLQFVVGREP